jgi:hypothetical protein
MKRIDALGKPVVIREGEHATLDTEVTPLPPGEAAQK